jgi:hypothetical protein
MENPSTDSVDPNADPQAKTTKTVTDMNLVAEIPPPVGHKDERSYSHHDVHHEIWRILHAYPLCEIAYFSGSPVAGSAIFFTFCV